MGQRRFDIYGLGMTMHYLLTGEKPKNSSFTVKPIREINPELPEKLEMIINKCIESNPENRYRSCNDVLKALEGEFMYDIKTFGLYFRKRLNKLALKRAIGRAECMKPIPEICIDQPCLYSGLIYDCSIANRQEID